MTGPQGVAPVDSAIRMGRGMRVVLFDQNAEIRSRVRSAINQDHGFVFAGECREWAECEILLDRFVPELLIASVTEVPAKFLERLSDSAFPVMVGLRREDDPLTTRGGMYDSLPIPAEPDEMRNLLGRVQAEIYRRKADELSSLLQLYMACAGKCEQYLSRLKVEDEKQPQEIAVENVRFIAADGNYLHVHTDSRTYEIRDTMTAISAKLDPSRFARVHRSFIVNLTYARDVVTKDGAVAFVRLSTGMEVPVGPNYREEFESAISTRGRLSA